MAARMKIRHKRFQPIRDKFHRTPDEQGCRCCGHLVAVGVYFHAESAADIGRDHTHIVFRQAKVMREYPLHHVRHLRRMPHRQLRIGGIVVSEYRARFECHRRMPPGSERGLDHVIGGGKNVVYFSVIDNALDTQIAAERRMYHRRGGIQRGFDVGDRWQRIVIHLDKLHGILGQRPRLCHHHCHRLALPARHLHRQRQLRRGLHALDVLQHANVRLTPGGNIRARDHAHDAWQLDRRRNIQPRDTCMRVRTAQHGGVQHAGQLNVVNKLPAPGEQALGVGAWEGGADGAGLFCVHCCQ